MDSKNEELIFQDELAQTLHKAVLGEPEWDPVMAGACRKAACDGLVLLKNEGCCPWTSGPPPLFSAGSRTTISMWATAPAAT